MFEQPPARPLLPPDLTPQQDVALGAALGALVGDAVGAVLEFRRETLTEQDVLHAMTMPGGGVLRVAPGQITDDGELAVALASAISKGSGRYRVTLAAEAYVDWADSGPFDMGRATTNAFGHGRGGRSLSTICRREASRHNAASKANGALMRVAPLAVASARWKTPSAIRAAQADAMLSHPNATCVQVNAAYVLSIRHLVLNPGDATSALRVCREFLEAEGSEALAWFDDAVAGNLSNPRELVGFVKHGFMRAVHHVHRQSSFQDALLETLLPGGDTDTNACIVGGLLGALHGIGRMSDTESGKFMVESVLRSDPSQGQPRPDRFHGSNMVSFVMDHL
jgi:ADP-ribosylglycohydrolase